MIRASAVERSHIGRDGLRNLRLERRHIDGRLTNDLTGLLVEDGICDGYAVPQRAITELEPIDDDLDGADDDRRRQA
jgi:hypothetical protein